MLIVGCVILCVSTSDGQRGQGLSAHPARVRRRTNCNRAGTLLGNGRRPSSYSHQLTILIPTILSPTSENNIIGILIPYFHQLTLLIPTIFSPIHTNHTLTSSYPTHTNHTLTKLMSDELKQDYWHLALQKTNT